MYKETCIARTTPDICESHGIERWRVRIWVQQGVVYEVSLPLTWTPFRYVLISGMPLPAARGAPKDTRAPDMPAHIHAQMIRAILS